MYNILETILESIKIECFILSELSKGLDENSVLRKTLEDIKTFRSICYGEQNIGKAVIQIGHLTQDQLFKIYPDIDWEDIKGMKDHLVHEYFNIDEASVISTAVYDIPILESTVTTILKDIRNGKLNKLLTYVEMAQKDKDFIIPAFPPFQKKP